MSVGRVCSRETVICRGHETLASAARLMLERHVGTVVVVDDHGGAAFPIAIVTDRDVLRFALAGEQSLTRITALDAATRDILTVREEEDLAVALDAMLSRSVRRAPVIDRSGALVGIISVDDIVGYLGEQIAKLARLVESQPARERS